MDGFNSYDHFFQSSDYKRGHVLKKFLFWIRKNIKRDKQCRCFCPMCQYYLTCKNDE